MKNLSCIGKTKSYPSKPMREVWFKRKKFKSIPGDNRFVSNDGQILSLRLREPKILKPAPDRDGYMKVSRPEVKIHIAVLRAWRGEKPIGQQARHLNGDKIDNHVSNLKWGTSKQNGKDKAAHGTAKGIKNPACKMTEQTVLRLREEYKSKPLSVLVLENPYSKFAIWAAVSGYTWTHLPNATPKNRTCHKGSSK